MSHVLFEGRRTSAGPRVWRTDRTGRYLLSGPAKEFRPLPRYGWGDDSDDTLALAADLLSAIGTPPALADHLAPALALAVLCGMPDQWELTSAQIVAWRDGSVRFSVTVLPADW